MFSKVVDSIKTKIDGFTSPSVKSYSISSEDSKVIAWKKENSKDVLDMNKMITSFIDTEKKWKKISDGRELSEKEEITKMGEYKTFKQKIENADPITLGSLLISTTKKINKELEGLDIKSEDYSNKKSTYNNIVMLVTTRCVQNSKILNLANRKMSFMQLPLEEQKEKTNMLLKEMLNERKNISSNDVIQQVRLNDGKFKEYDCLLYKEKFDEMDEEVLRELLPQFLETMKEDLKNLKETSNDPNRSFEISRGYDQFIKDLSLISDNEEIRKILRSQMKNFAEICREMRQLIK